MRNALIKNTAILIASNIIVRLIGLAYKVWLSRSISSESLGLYQLGMSVYMLFVTFAASGLPNVVSRYSAARFARNDINGAGSALKNGLKIGWAVSIFSAAFMLAAANMIAGLIIRDANAGIIVLALIPAVLFGGVGAIPTGYLHACGRSWVSALSEIIEQLFKVGFVISMFHIFGASNQYTGAAIAAAGISAGGIISFIVIRLLTGKLPGKTDKNSMSEMVKAAAPLTANRLIGSLLQMLTAIIIPLRLAAGGLTQSEALSVYGVLTGMAMPIVFLPSTITSAVCVVLLPDIARTRAYNNLPLLSSKIKRAMFSIGGIALFSAIIISMLARPAGDILYNQPMAGSLMLALAPYTVINGLTHISSTILNGLGHEGKTFKISITGGIISLLLTYILTAPLGIYGYILAMLIQSAVCLALNLICIKLSLRGRLSKGSRRARV